MDGDQETSHNSCEGQDLRRAARAHHQSIEEVCERRGAQFHHRNNYE